MIAALLRTGFVVIRTKGSHKMLQHAQDASRRTVVPDHGARDLKIGTPRAIIAQAGLTIEEFKTLI